MDKLFMGIAPPPESYFSLLYTQQKHFLRLCLMLSCTYLVARVLKLYIRTYQVLLAIVMYVFSLFFGLYGNVFIVFYQHRVTRIPLVPQLPANYKPQCIVFIIGRGRYFCVPFFLLWYFLLWQLFSYIYHCNYTQLCIQEKY